MKKPGIESLYKLQNEILLALSEFAEENDFPFVFTGGTALVRFILKNPYRVSYDLDFFSDRLKDLDKLTPLPAFVKYKFIPIIKENAGTLELEEFLTSFRLLHKILNRNRGKVNEILRETLSTLTFKDILKWIKERSEALKEYFQQNP